MKISLDALIVLEAIHRNGSFAKAADELHRVRSALTYTINKLESDLKVTLFDRSQHRAKLTPIGEFLLRQGSQLLLNAREVEREVYQISTGWEEELRIAVDGVISAIRLYPLLSHFYRECPHTRLAITEEILGGGWDALITERADLVIGVSGDPPLEKNYGIASLGNIAFVFAVAPFHPLAKVKEPLKNDEILKHRAIVVPDTSTSKTTLLRSSGTILGQDVLKVPSLHAKIEAQLAGLGVGFLPSPLIHDHITHQRLKVMTVEKPKPTGIFSVAWHLGKVGKATEWLLSQLKDPAVRASLFN